MSTTCGCEHCHSHGSSGLWMPTISFVLLVIGLIGKYSGISWFAESWIEAIWFLVAFLPVGLPVMREAWEAALRKDFFSEFSLMAIASIGAFCIGEYPEAVAVMLFYTVGERLQLLAVNKASKNISDLLDVRPERTDVWRTGTYMNVSPKDVKVGERIEVKPGGRVPLDGVLLEAEAQFDTSALTGESMPRSIREGEEVLAGMIVQGQAVRIQVNRPYEQSALARILALVKDASERKAPAELFIRRFARIYTPIVILLSFLIVSVPALVGMVTPSFQYVFSDWLYRGLVFLVISCPCALVISVPLGYFGGIGAASRAGILFKGGNYLDAITRVNTVAFDKTGTLTEGHPTVAGWLWAQPQEGHYKDILLAAELKSEHPLAGAIVTALQEQENIAPATLDGFESITGKGIKVTYQGAEYWAGSHKLLKDYHATLTDVLGEMLAQYESDGCSIVYFGRKDELLAIVAIKDQIKATSAEAVRELRTQGIEVYMLTGDGERTASAVAGRLGNIQYIADALPDDKEEFVRQLQLQRKTVAMVGDGINDSQALACADVSIAMGKGTDIAMDVAMVTLMTSDLLLLPKAFNLSRQTVRLIHQNLFWAFIYNLIGIPIAAGLLYPINGLLLNPMLASAAMAFSSVSVVLNSLRLRY